MQCDYFDAGRCGSCTLMGVPHELQVAQLQASVATRLAHRVAAEAWHAPAVGPESGFRNKAKLVIGGEPGSPTVGILDGERRGVDLRDCGLYEPGLHQAVHAVADWVAQTGLTPYDVPRRSGELKHVIITHSPDGEQLVRLVLRSPGQQGRVERALDDLRRRLPSVRVVSVNLLPGHQALLEGEEETVLTEQRSLPIRVDDVTLHLPPRSFFQTNTQVAAALYRQAREWARGTEATTIWDLYCGIGGFAIHLARGLPHAAVTGVELSADAVAGARAGAEALGRPGPEFVAGDATSFAEGREPPELVVVNPPRRGIGESLAGWLEGSSVRWVLYSSCNAERLAQDLARMPSLQVVQARLFAMFPQTHHHEVLVLLRRR